MKKMVKKIGGKTFFSILFLCLISLVFSWQFFLKGLIPIPADVTVGIYYPWRDHIWSGMVAGVPFKNGLLSDVVSIIYPWRIYGMEVLKTGHLPLWMPYALGGSPLLANFQSGILYPLNFLFFIFSKVDAWSFYIILQPVLASIFTFLYLRNLKLSQFSSLIGGLIFAFSGFMMVWFEYGIVGHAALWLPLFLLVVDKSKEKNYLRWIIAGSFFIGFSILSGYPQISFYAIGVSVAYSLFRFFQTRDKLYFRGLLGIGLGVILSAIQILPGFELFRQSIRQSDPTAAAFLYGILPLKDLVLFVFPDFFGNPSTGNWWGWAAYNESAGYIGIFGLYLAFLGLIYSGKGRETSLFFKIFLVVSLLLTFDTPVAHLVKNLNLPGLSAASSGRYLFLIDFCLAVLSAFGVDILMKGKDKKRQIILLSLLGIIFFLTWFFVLFGAKYFFPAASWLPNLVVSKRNLILPSLVLLVVLAVFVVGFFLKQKNKQWLWFVIVLAVIFDLFRFGWKYNPFTRREYLYPPTNLTDFLKQNESFDRFVGLIPQSMWMPYNLSSPEGYEPLMNKRFSEFANQINEEKPTSPQPGSRWVKVNNFSSPLLDVMAVRYLVSYKGDIKTGWDPEYFKYPEERYKLVFQFGNSQVYENKKSLPGVLIASTYRVITDKQEIMKSLLDRTFDLSKTVILEEEISFPKNQSAVGPSEVIVSSDGGNPDNLSFKTKTDQPGILFISTTYYPGWKALVDGVEARVLRANYIFTAIPLPAGSHQVEFIYDPESVRIGGRISAATLGFLLFLILYELKGRAKTS